MQLLKGRDPLKAPNKQGTNHFLMVIGGLLLHPLTIGICQMFYTGKIPNFFNFTREKGVNFNLFGKIMIIEDALLIYLEKFVI